MSDLSSIEKIPLEKFLLMGGGYVLDFSNQTFQTFVFEYTGIDIDDSKYSQGYSGSKANRLRVFWKIESNHNVAKLLFAFLDYWKTKSKNTNSLDFAENLYNDCYKIYERLKNESISQHIDPIQPNNDDKDFHLLSKLIRQSIIENNEPQAALDRLHTFTVKFIRELCDKHNIKYDKDKPLQSIFGEYVKHLKGKNIFETKMTEIILKSSISVLDSFNNVRNNKSYAHDNSILNYYESMLIFKNISSLIEFLQNMEANIHIEKSMEETDSDLPF